MRQLLEWAKSMPLTIISVVAVLVSLGFLGWVWSSGSAFRDEMRDQEGQVSQIQSMMNQSIPMPAEEPGGQPVMLRNLTINQYTIETLSDLFRSMEREYDQIRELAIEHNRAGREPLIEGLFPEPEDSARPFQARERYRQVLPGLLRSPEEARQGEAAAVEAAAGPAVSLIAGLPPLPGELADDLESFSRDYRESLTSMREQRMQRQQAARPGQRGQRDRRVSSAQQGELSADEIRELNEEKRSRLKDALYRRAQNIHLYAQPDAEGQQFPLDIHPLATSPRPQDFQLWEAQLELWIQQDILRAIARVNGIDEPGANVLTGPFKRLFELEVVPGYVGLHTVGALVGQTPPSEPYFQPETYNAPPEGEVPRNFYVGPTGRVSNPLYDVRHVRVDAVVDYQRLPEIYNAIHAVNFMTVLSTQIHGIDEYEHYREGFVYGENVDAVRVEMVVESLWLRDWTEPLMPERVKRYVGILDPVDLDGEGMMGPGMGPGGAPFGPEPDGPDGPGGPDMQGPDF